MPSIQGPLFDGSAGRIIDDAVQEIDRQIARETQAAIQSRLGSVLQHPTGKYQRGIRITEQGGRATVDDSRSVYGPWLEGTGSRNGRTRFKGYATFRKVSQQIERQAQQIAERVMDRYVGRLK